VPHESRPSINCITAERKIVKLSIQSPRRSTAPARSPTPGRPNEAQNRPLQSGLQNAAPKGSRRMRSFTFFRHSVPPSRISFALRMSTSPARSFDPRLAPPATPRSSASASSPASRRIHPAQNAPTPFSASFYSSGIPAVSIFSSKSAMFLLSIVWSPQLLLDRLHTARADSSSALRGLHRSCTRSGFLLRRCWHLTSSFARCLLMRSSRADTNPAVIPAAPACRSSSKWGDEAIKSASRPGFIAIDRNRLRYVASKSAKSHNLLELAHTFRWAAAPPQATVVAPHPRSAHTQRS